MPLDREGGRECGRKGGEKMEIGFSRRLCMKIDWTGGQVGMQFQIGSDSCVQMS